MCGWLFAALTLLSCHVSVIVVSTKTLILIINSISALIDWFFNKKETLKSIKIFCDSLPVLFLVFFFLSEFAVKTSTYKTIHEAVKKGDVEAVASMVKDGASVNELQDTKDRFTPVHWACYKGALEVCFTIIFQYFTL